MPWLCTRSECASATKIRPSLRHRIGGISDAAQPRAWNRRPLGAARRHDGKVGLILEHQRAGSDHAFLSDRHMVAQGDVDADKTALTDPDAAGYDDMGGDEDI